MPVTLPLRKSDDEDLPFERSVDGLWDGDGEFEVFGEVVRRAPDGVCCGEAGGRDSVTEDDSLTRSGHISMSVNFPFRSRRRRVSLNQAKRGAS